VGTWGEKYWKIGKTYPEEGYQGNSRGRWPYRQVALREGVLEGGSMRSLVATALEGSYWRQRMTFGL